MLTYYHVDVFSHRPLQGNGLTVVFADKTPDRDVMQEITREFRQFETIFLLKPLEDGSFPARIFTCEEELAFAGHPVLGAGGVLHHRFFRERERVSTVLTLGDRRLSLLSEKAGDHYRVSMDQGKAVFSGSPGADCLEPVLDRLGLTPADIPEGFDAETVSTGLPYLLIPTDAPLEHVSVRGRDFEACLARCGAKFVYVYNPETLECRTWDNLGIVEDVATGSAAGPLCASLVKNGRRPADELIRIRQGRFAGRPGIIEGRVDREFHVTVRGDVSLFASGEIALSV